ncbi:beta-glucosidase [Bimuria novae-zelandiae CBS 107.79]|uniref:beta-glucosidase n=1 Tax=Bimuria novae-zelandiae CBS 107.79 TaxID=1447943 RepID=A0A6A5UN29_9PLEO|nr:beta-glucosidase [Bimuria novae-zelandiae CBS 107.79]
MTESHLPKDFLWGFATACYQIEGSPKADAKGDSIWDVFSHIPGKVWDGTTGDVACDSYNRTAEDIELLKSTGANTYRFSLSWARIIPLGGRNDPVNEKGLQHYVKFVDDLHAAGIEPLVTLLHWDLPNGLWERYGGYLNKDEFAKDFENYARVVFKAFGSKVKYWITFNEPWCSSILGFNVACHAPGRTSDRSKSDVGDSSREPWIVGHSLMIAHARAVKVYRDEFKAKDGGIIAITLNGDYAEPWDADDPLDVEAANRKLEFTYGWFADPIYHGKYPDSMRKQLGDRLPEFTAEEIALVKGSNDFFGINSYGDNYIKHKEGAPPPDDYYGNLEVLDQNKAGEWIGPETESVWLRPNPRGFRSLLNWLSKRYGGPTFYVTENGTSVKGENDLPREEILNDEFRCWFFRGYIGALADAYTLDGVDVRGYTGWSLLDNYEWHEGYRTRFGVTYVDYEGGQKRYPKKSAHEVGRIFAKYIKKD